MKFRIVAVGKIKEKYFSEAIAEYVKRISRFASTEIVEADECAFNGKPNPSEILKITEKEGRSLLQKCEGFVIALDIDGQQLTSAQLSQTLKNAESRFPCITFVIGGSYGLSEEMKKRSDLRLSFGKITLPHQLCRVVLCEQIYRACTIQNNMPYHK